MLAMDLMGGPPNCLSRVSGNGSAATISTAPEFCQIQAMDSRHILLAIKRADKQLLLLRIAEMHQNTGQNIQTSATSGIGYAEIK